MKLNQGDTSIKAVSMMIDDKSGDLSAAGDAGNPVFTSMVQEEPGKDQKPDRLRSNAKAADMKYDDDLRRLVYTGGAHMDGPAGDMTADKIELFLKASGDEIDRVEAYTKITLKETSGRTTTGSRLTYTSAGERYTVSGTPVHVVEACGRGHQWQDVDILNRGTDRIEVTGGDANRTETVGTGSNCS